MTSNKRLKYSAVESVKMTKEEIAECALLFSESYGKYSKESPRRPGENATMSASFFQRRYCKPDIYIATCKNYHNRLVGQAIYLRKKYPDVGNMTWVLQLVVDAKYRKQGIGSTLLHSIWGFSDDFAWGLATANPCTIRALESATFRRCKPSIIKKNLQYVKRMAEELDFVKEDRYIVDNNQSMAFTDFFIDNTEFSNKMTSNKDWYLGELKPGHEWIAFVFREQTINHEIYEKHFPEMLAFSEKKLKDAYSRMKIDNHPWARGEKNEVDSILARIDGKVENVLDLGCGTGRHAIEFANRGYKVTGIDFSLKHINKAKQKSKNMQNSPIFKTADAREVCFDEKFDLVISLFDVIGSFPDEKENQKIINSIAKNTKKGGYCAISVMNLKRTENVVPEEQQGDVLQNTKLLYDLKPCNIMQESGDVFNPDYMVLDNCTGIVYRKEQFVNDDELPAEYIIRDKRYYMEEIVKMIEHAGFEVKHRAFVQANRFDISLDAIDDKAKEILIIAKKL